MFGPLVHVVETAGVEKPNLTIKALPQIVAWTEAIEEAVYKASAEGMPIVLGGDHSLAAGTLAGLSRRAAEMGREFFVLWLDAHPDFHTLDSTQSGNLHGVPVAYATGGPGFSGVFPPLAAPVKPGNICMMGIRSVDAAEREALASAGIAVHDMRAIDEHGVGPLLDRFLQRVAGMRPINTPVHLGDARRVVQAAAVVGVGCAAASCAAFQFQGRSSSMALAGWSGNLARTKASQACGLTSFNLQLSMSV